MPVFDVPKISRADATRVEKPWGYEIRWATTERFLGKVLHVNKGESLSLQYHRKKDESQLVVKGVVDIQLGGDDGALQTFRMTVGDTLRITPGTRHRITAVEDADIFEVSTPEIDDIVRLEDRYGRVGT